MEIVKGEGDEKREAWLIKRVRGRSNEKSGKR